MKNFDSKWQTCAARGRQAARPDSQAPFGFAARVAARALGSRTNPEGFSWEREMAGLLAGAVVVLLVCVAVEWPHLGDSRPLEPGIENTVAQLVWSL